ncbi:MAG: hypothetical protein M1812_007724 [Candelaria pacifica]|nr:MAG: hypothetical protein M1812_007724 [Candelaria pacifica]
MATLDVKARKKTHLHPYLAGNFAPIHRVQPLTPCSYTGHIPSELIGGEYVRNGGNPVTNEDLGRDAHWFDGDGMLSGVAFRRVDDGLGGVRPEFVNQYILTDVYLSSRLTPSLQTPILPSIATLVNPLSSLITILLRIFRTILLVLLSHLPGSMQAIKKISVANTAIIYHDGRALATCESGPPMRVSLPALESVGWFNGKTVEGENNGEAGAGFGGKGLLGFLKEWTTAHPRIDPVTAELILFHSTFAPPYIHYSIIPATQQQSAAYPSLQSQTRLISQPVAGVSSAKMMHDFGVSPSHTVILDLPLSLDPLNLAKNRPVVSYNPSGRSRFGIFPRYHPENVRWFQTDACCIFHTANTWDDVITMDGEQVTTGINMLACRLTSASLVFSAGDLAAPIPTHSPAEKEEEQCRLYYYQFSLEGSHNTIRHQWALSAIPFEFPSLRDDVSMSSAKFIYGCSVGDSSFGAALGRAVKIDSLVKLDVQTLIARGKRKSPTPVSGCVDMRSVSEVLASEDPQDPIKVFKMPPGWYAQESSFVARKNGDSEDDGWLVTYVFDESQLDENGECWSDAKSELWVIDARNMKDVIARVYLPQRVPYGLHGNWFSEVDVLGQRPFETVRHLPSSISHHKSTTTKSINNSGALWTIWMKTRGYIEGLLG